MGGPDEDTTLADPLLLKKIDSLFACNVGEYISLPQLVVVGDQSSGKSSVLEGLTKLPFPRDSGLCTRFATQIIFQRAPKARIHVSIIPEPEATSEHKEMISAWQAPELETFDAGIFAGVMHEVHDLMGLSSGREEGNSSSKTFSNDILRLEICGPEQEHFSVIDIPGIFRKRTEGLTTLADKELVKNMVLGYMENPRSVILAVIPANVDVATQDILEMAADVDPEGHRTIGVLTKPDLVDVGGEKNVVDLVEGRAHRLTHGWNLVRNLGQADILDPNMNRQLKEDIFFRYEVPWNALDKSRVGIRSLRARLQDILTVHIRREFPKVRNELNKRLKVAKAGLKELGAERDDPEKQRSYLLELAARFQTITSQALKADYGNLNFEDSKVSRLATALVDRNDRFSRDISNWGHQYTFRTESAVGVPCSDEKTSYAAEDGHQNTDESSSGSEIDSNEDNLEIRAVSCEGVEDILHDREQVVAPYRSGIFDWLQKVFLDSRSLDLASAVPSLLRVIMKKQAAKWFPIALGYVSDMIAIDHQFIVQLLRCLCPDERVREALLGRLMDGLRKRYEKAIKHAEFLLCVELNGNPYTLNHYFIDNLQRLHGSRFQKSIARKAWRDTENRLVAFVDEMAEIDLMDNTEYTVLGLHDKLKSYYKVARKRFVDNVYLQAASFHLISGPQTPLNLFCPIFVSKLSLEDLEEIAGEDDGVKRKRGQLKREIRDLEKGKSIVG